MKISETIAKKIFDDNAETIDELMLSTGATRHHIASLRDDGIKSGKWEQVWKKINGRAYKAYRIKKK